jgi:ribonuclease HI
MGCPTAYRHQIHRETLEPIRHNLRTRRTSGIRTHLGKLKAHSHSLGNKHADALANQVADRHHRPTRLTTRVNTYLSVP